MSENQLRKAARLKVPQQMPDVETKILMMVMADRADDAGSLTADDDAMDQIVQEVNAVKARLEGDPFVRAGVDNQRVTRVVNAFRDAED
jgi:hypothetical protein